MDGQLTEIREREERYYRGGGSGERLIRAEVG